MSKQTRTKQHLARHWAAGIVRSPSRALLVSVALAAVGFAAIHLSSAAVDPSEPAADPAGQILVRYKTGADASAMSRKLRSVDAVQTDEAKSIGVKVLKVPKERRQQILADLKADPGVEFAEPDVERKAFATLPNDTDYSRQWNLHLTSTDVLWDRTKGSAGVTVAVLDSGINFAHPEFAGRTVAGYDFVNNDADPADDFGHGSFVSGIIGAMSDNGAGVAGACWNCKLMPLKTIGADGKGTSAAAVKAIEHAVNNGARIINASYGGPETTQAEQAAVEYAASKGVLFVAAAGNSAAETIYYPAAYPSTIAVAATDTRDALASFSTFGPHVDIAAPGIAYSTVHNGDGFKADQGTSFSTPLVSGILGLLWSAYPSATPAQLKDAITKSADVCCANKITGGRINAAKAAAYLAGNGAVADTVKPTVSFVSPPAGLSVHGKAVPVIASPADDVAVSKVHFTVDSFLPFVDVEPPYMFAFDSTSVPDGQHTLVATVYDSSGNMTTVTRPFAVNNAAPADTEKPTASITAPAEGAVISGASVDIDISASDNSGVSLLTIKLNDKVAAYDFTSPYGFKWDTTKSADGQYTVSVSVRDTTGNETVVTRKLTVRNAGATPNPNPNPDPGPGNADLNSDGKVNISDLSTLLSNWGKASAQADLNKSGKVDIADLSTLLSKWTR